MVFFKSCYMSGLDFKSVKLATSLKAFRFVFPSDNTETG